MGNLFDTKPASSKLDVISILANVANWMMDHFAYTSFILIIGATISTYIVFKKARYNWAEHFVLNSFLVGLILAMSRILLQVLYIVKLKGARFTRLRYLFAVFDFYVDVLVLCSVF